MKTFYQLERNRRRALRRWSGYRNAAVYGYRGLVKEILARLEGELGVRPAVVATGGDAALIARGVERIDHVDPDITLNGLRIAAGLNL